MLPYLTLSTHTSISKIYLSEVFLSNLNYFFLDYLLLSGFGYILNILNSPPEPRPGLGGCSSVAQM